MRVAITVEGKGSIESLVYNGAELVSGGNRCTGLTFSIEGHNAPTLRPDLRPPVPARDPREHPRTPKPGPRMTASAQKPATLREEESA